VRLQKKRPAPWLNQELPELAKLVLMSDMLLTSDAKAQNKNLNHLEIPVQVIPNPVLHFIAS